MAKGADSALNIRWIGAVIIFIACSGLGFMLSNNLRREATALCQLIRALEYMICQLEYSAPVLPKLCMLSGKHVTGCVAAVMRELGHQMEQQISPDTGSCMEAALLRVNGVPESCREMLLLLGSTLGRFDLHGQVKELERLKLQTEALWKELEREKPQRQRTYQTLGVCAGAALVILFI